MKLSTILAAIVLPIVLMPTSLQAAPNVFKGATLEDCKLIEKSARHVMDLRQSGAPMSDLLSRIRKEEDGSAAHKVTKVMIVSAYEESRAYSDGFKKRSVDDFAEKWFKVCYL